MALCALFTALMTVSGWIRIPLPLVALTLQTQVAVLSGLLLGVWGGLSVFLYAVLGLLGLPIFAGGGGFAYLLSPSFGFIIGFAVAALLIGAIIRGQVISYGRIFFATALGLVITYAIGIAYAALIFTCYLHTPALLAEMLVLLAAVTLPKDVLLCAAAAPLAKRLLRYTL